MKKIFLLFFVALVALIGRQSAAIAGFYIDNASTATKMSAAGNNEESASGQKTGNARIIHIGTMPRDIPPSKGMGEDIPLSLAIQQIMPDGWSVYFDDDGQGQDIQTSWTGSDIWIKSLERVLARVDGTATVDWSRKVVTVKVTPPAKEDTVETPLAGEDKAAPAKVADRVWKVKYTDINIQGTLRRWAEESGEGWQISWESPMEFPTVLEAEFHGTFRNAVDGVVSALAASEAPVWVRYYDNKVVRIIPAGTKTE